MKKMWWTFVASALTLLAASCGGGGSGADSAAASPSDPLLATSGVAARSRLTCATSAAECPALAIGGSATGTISSGNDRAWHEVSLEAGQAYSFSLEGASTGQGTLRDPLLRLFNDDGWQLTSDNDSGVGFNASMVCAPTAGGTYYVSAEGAPADAGTYRLSVTAVPGPAPACEARPNDPGVDWSSPAAAPAIWQGTFVLGAHQRTGLAFNVTDGNLPIETMFASQGGADLYVMSSADLPGCLAGGAFNFVAQASFEQQTGYRSFTLPPGSYAICARNPSSAAMTMTVKMQDPVGAAGFHFSRQQFAPVAQTVSAGARVVQPVSASDAFRIFIDGANTGGIFYVIPPEETQNFLAGQPFQHYPTLTQACGGLGAAGTAAPQLCELPGPWQYGIAYVNNTGSTQSMVLVGREYVPD